MSLLEDVFLEDEAGEARELERVIEGDEYDERPLSPYDSDNGSEKEDEAVEDKRRVEPTQAKSKRVIKNPRFILNPARLTGPRGIQILPEHFKDFKFKGKGHEKEDLDLVMKKLEHWAYRLYPKFEFKDCLKKIETLGKKKSVMVHLHKIRTDQYTSEETVIQKDSSDDEAPPAEEDEFDKLLQQQIELARTTPAPQSARKQPYTPIDHSHIMPKATSSPSINEEQRERMLKNRRLAEERRLAKLKQAESNFDEIKKIDNEEAEEQTDEIIIKKHVRSNVIDSSDDEDGPVISEAVTVDIHNTISSKTNKEITINNHIESKESEVEDIEEITDLTGDNKVTNSSISDGGVIDITDTNPSKNINDQVIEIDMPDRDNVNSDTILSKDITNRSNVMTIQETIEIMDNTVYTTTNQNDLNITNSKDIIEQEVINLSDDLNRNKPIDIRNSLEEINNVDINNENILNTDANVSDEFDNINQNLIDSIKTSFSNKPSDSINLETNKLAHDKKNLTQNTVEENLMDVDFSEEF